MDDSDDDIRREGEDSDDDYQQGYTSDPELRTG